MKLLGSARSSINTMNTINTEFCSVEVWFTEQSSKPFEIEDNINLTVIIG